MRSVRTKLKRKGLSTQPCGIPTATLQGMLVSVPTSTPSSQRTKAEPAPCTTMAPSVCPSSGEAARALPKTGHSVTAQVLMPVPLLPVGGGGNPCGVVAADSHMLEAVLQGTQKNEREVTVGEAGFLFQAPLVEILYILVRHTMLCRTCKHFI